MTLVADPNLVECRAESYGVTRDKRLIRLPEGFRIGGELLDGRSRLLYLVVL
jgi:hypothetical protein